MQDTTLLDLQQGTSLPLAVTKPAWLEVSPRSTGPPLLKISVIFVTDSFLRAAMILSRVPFAPLTEPFIHRCFLSIYGIPRPVSARKDEEMDEILTIR